MYEQGSAEVQRSVTLTKKADISGPAHDAVRSGGGTGPVGRFARRLGRWPDLLAAISYLVGAVGVLAHLLKDPVTRVVAGGARDQALGEWMLSHGARVVTRFDAPFVTYQMNVPDGVNIMANHGILGLSIPLTPVTLLLGPAATFALAVTLSLAGTAYAWYYVLSRHLVRSRSAAFVGGALGGFAPGMISHAQGNLGLVAQFLVPFLIWRVVRLREPGRALRNGLVLGLLATWQALIDDEVLFLFALGCCVFLIAYWALRPSVVRRQAPTFLRGLGVAIAVCAVLLAYPLSMQFFGPAHHPGGPAAGGRGADIFSFVRFSSPSLATWPLGGVHYAPTPNEQNSFFGWPLLVLLALSVWWLRTAIVRALAATAVVLALLSLGSQLIIRGRTTPIPGPWRLFAAIPGVNSVPPAHIALAVLPIAVVLLALAGERAARLITRARLAHQGTSVALAWYGLVAAALLPIAPTPVKASDAPIPRFVTDGAWRTYIPAGQSLVTLPLAAWGGPNEPRWAAAAGPELTFLGGDLGDALNRVARTHKERTVGAADQAVAWRNLRHGRAAAVVLVPGTNEEILRKTTSSLLGFEPQWVDGVWLWDLRTVR
jgi:hypothetical protein